MWRPTSRSSEHTSTVAASVLALAVWAAPSIAHAQACCAGGSAVTPGRLELHEDALVGVVAKAATVLGAYSEGGHYGPSQPGVTEGDFEQDVFGAVRVAKRGQVVALVPFIETQRQSPTDGGHFGGGFGDINLGARYDFVLAGESRYIPGIALLAGVTFPTGRPPEDAKAPLAVDATGIGAYQASGALAFEQTFGPWLFNVTGLAAWRSSRSDGQLALQWTVFGAAAYTLPNDVAIALSLSYSTEGDARTAQGAALPLSGKSLTTATLGTLWPFADSWRLLGNVYVDPPVSGVGTNQAAALGLALTIIRSWS